MARVLHFRGKPLLHPCNWRLVGSQKKVRIFLKGLLLLVVVLVLLLVLAVIIIEKNEMGRACGAYGGG